MTERDFSEFARERLLLLGYSIQQTIRDATFESGKIASLARRLFLRSPKEQSCEMQYRIKCTHSYQQRQESAKDRASGGAGFFVYMPSNGRGPNPKEGVKVDQGGFRVKVNLNRKILVPFKLARPLALSNGVLSPVRFKIPNGRSSCPTIVLLLSKNPKMAKGLSL